MPPTAAVGCCGSEDACAATVELGCAATASGSTNAVSSAAPVLGGMGVAAVSSACLLSSCPEYAALVCEAFTTRKDRHQWHATPRSLTHDQQQSLRCNMSMVSPSTLGPKPQLTWSAGRQCDDATKVPYSPMLCVSHFTAVCRAIMPAVKLLSCSRKRLQESCQHSGALLRDLLLHFSLRNQTALHLKPLYPLMSMVRQIERRPRHQKQADLIKWSERVPVPRTPA
jgi:hypothetical protein